MEPSKYFVFNKKRDYLSGYLEHVRFTGQGIELDTKAPGQFGTFISRLLDSKTEGNLWHRAVIHSKDYGDDSIRFFFYCSDSKWMTYEGRETAWEELIRRTDIAAEEKHRLMAPCLVDQMLNPEDVLLYRGKGRFLWMEIQLFRQAQATPKIFDMKIYAQNESFLKYLPEIYRGPENDFLKRYLSLFETLYQELDTKIRTSAGQLEPETAEPEFLRWMASWVGITQIHLWKEEKLRVLLQGIVKKNLIRGTKAYMKYMLEVFTGETPFFVEYEDIEQFKGNHAVYDRLKRYYARDPYTVNILIRQRVVLSRQEHKALEKVIDDMKPAHIEIHLIILKPYIYLNQNVYAGVNSVLGTYQTARLTESVSIPSVVGR